MNDKPTHDSASPALPRFGKYHVVRAIGEGGGGQVFEAEDTLLRRRVAVKLLSKKWSNNADMLKRFLREARAVAKLNHPHVVGIHEIAEHEGNHILVLELMAGGSGEDVLRSRGPLPWREATRSIREIASALLAAHEAGLIHRDIKPANVLFTKDGRAKLADFGLVKQLDTADELAFSQSTGKLPSPSATVSETVLALTQVGAVVGTPFFMSPEQCCGEPLDNRSDIYSLGATYFALLAGRPPFIDRTWAALVRSHCYGKRPDPRLMQPAIPAACVTLLHRALAKEPRDRYADTGELLKSLDTLLALPEAPPTTQEDIIDRAASPIPTVLLDYAAPVRTIPSPPRRSTRSRVWLLTGLGLAALILTAGGLMFLPGVRDVLARWAGGNGPRDEVFVLPEKIDTADEVYCLAMRGRYLAWGMVGPNNPVVVRDLRAEKADMNLSLHGRATALALWPEQNLLAVGTTQNGKVRRWNLTTGNEEASAFIEHANITSLSFAPGGPWLAAGIASWDPHPPRPRIQIWHGLTMRPEQTLFEHTDNIHRLRFSRDGRSLVSGDDAGLVILWDVKTWKARQRFTGLDLAHDVDVSSDGKLVAAVGYVNKKSALLIWDAPTGQRLHILAKLPGDAFAISFAPQGDMLAYDHLGGPGFVDARTGRLLETVPRKNQGAVTGLVFLNNGTALVTGSFDKTIRFWMTPLPKDAK